MLRSKVQLDGDTEAVDKNGDHLNEPFPIFPF